MILLYRSFMDKAKCAQTRDLNQRRIILYNLSVPRDLIMRNNIVFIGPRGLYILWRMVNSYVSRIISNIDIVLTLTRYIVCSYVFKLVLNERKFKNNTIFKDKHIIFFNICLIIIMKHIITNYLKINLVIYK